MSLVLDPKQTGEPVSGDSYGLEQVNLIDHLLEEQKSLSAVERFSQKHEAAREPLLKSHYRDLIPIRKPSTGEQYAFEVDLDKCTGCKACVVACHSLNGLHENESWRDIGTIRGAVDGKVEQQTVTSACHHCADPACLNGCPVGAYEKEKDTGVVRHLDDQCIGCQYCSLKCPYDVPKYDASLGIVRKCDMCHERLADGEAPACVQSCPSGAIKIKVVETAAINEAAKGGRSILPGAFRSDYTKPSTTFRSERKFSEAMRAGDERDLVPAHAHTPLVWMLMLTQVAVGLLCVDVLGSAVMPSHFGALHLPLALIALVSGIIGLVASFLHLGSPAGAWRIFLGLKTSWLSREVVAFGAWAPALMGYVMAVAWPHIYSASPGFVRAWIPEVLPAWLPMVSLVTAVVLGVIGVLCSVMVYVDTQRAFWAMGKTLGRFAGTTVLGGFAGLLLVELVMTGSASGFAIAGVLAGVLVKSVMEISQLLPARAGEWSFAKKSALLQLRPLRKVLTLRWVMLVFSVLALVVGVTMSLLAWVVVGFTAMLVGEWLERRLFFQAVVTLKMPGEHSRPH